ncbi:MAG: hypothetical protein J6T46_03375, partial [Victivallales bacterium]|nr:hypothetical protein [Victivallales bacterium]
MIYTSDAERPFAAYPCDEKNVPPYELPDPLLRDDGSRVATAQEWMAFQRPKILDVFKKWEYGEILPRPQLLRFELLSQKDDALDGIAVRREIRIHAAMENGRSIAFIMLLYLPKDVAIKPVPAFLGLNFKGNHTTTPEDDVIPTGTDEPRGCQINRWCFKETIQRGYASATICYHDIFRDVTGHADESVFRL